MASRTDSVFDEYSNRNSCPLSSLILLPLVSKFKFDTKVASYLFLCSLWTIPPLLVFHLRLLSFFLVIFVVLSCFVVFNIAHNSYYVNIFFNFLCILFFLSINCNCFIYFSDNLFIIYIIPKLHRVSS